MWVYRNIPVIDALTGKTLGFSEYIVGFYSPDGEWHTESEYTSQREAVAHVHYLNGGSLLTPKTI